MYASWGFGPLPLPESKFVAAAPRSVPLSCYGIETKVVHQDLSLVIIVPEELVVVPNSN